MTFRASRGGLIPPATKATFAPQQIGDLTAPIARGGDCGGITQDSEQG